MSNAIRQIAAQFVGVNYNDLTTLERNVYATLHGQGLIQRNLNDEIVWADRSYNEAIRATTDYCADGDTDPEWTDNDDDPDDQGFTDDPDDRELNAQLEELGYTIERRLGIE